jgi:AcrR family transcriptional regulator
MKKRAAQKAATCNALLHALEEQLQQGNHLTVEAIADQADVNKALVYRYFGGLDGLLIAYAGSSKFMPDVAEIRLRCGVDLGKYLARERFVRYIQAYVAALVDRPATVQILLRMSSFSTETITALAKGRTAMIEELHEFFGKHERLNFDGDLAFNLLIAGICHLLGSRRDCWERDPISLEELSLRIAKTIGGLLLPNDNQRHTSATKRNAASRKPHRTSRAIKNQKSGSSRRK